MNLNDNQNYGIYDFNDKNSNPNQDHLEEVTNQMNATRIKKEKWDQEIENNTINSICNNLNNNLTEIADNSYQTPLVVKSEPLDFPGKPKNSGDIEIGKSML